ncbi:hypothetical protein RchiOBHm_Chr2g0145151 [Rosa chinensis]|uniref:Uncharacterized protein n=1 Tax=Rosa chinensis TaxID=74649 RepID=A0A2P6RYJ7_ROSCH|nr:hypothetical protein RchiOBHm_Chr2g0145151 [Rosa chinensis]
MTHLFSLLLPQPRLLQRGSLTMPFSRAWLLLPLQRQPQPIDLLKFLHLNPVEHVFGRISSSNSSISSNSSSSFIG